MDNLNDIIRREFYDPSVGMISAKNLYKKLKPNNPKITLKMITEFIKNQATHQIHAPKKIPLNEYHQIKAPTLGEFQLDILDLSNYSRHNNGFRYILVVVDIYSRYSFVRSLKTKAGSVVLEAMKSIEKEITKHKVKIYSFVMDQGSEFNNNAFNQHYPNVKMYRKNPEIHNSTGIVERRNKYIRDVLQKYFTAYHTLKWVDLLQKINTNINNTYNRTINHAPVDVWDKKEKNEEEPREAPTKYEVGDRVRLLISIY